MIKIVGRSEMYLGRKSMAFSQIVLRVTYQPEVRVAPRGNRLRVHQDIDIIDIMVRVLHVTNLMERTVHHNRSFAEMMKSELKRTR